MGRRSLCTPEMTKAICDRVEHLFATLREASADVGIDENTVLDWVRKGEAGNPKYTGFLRAWNVAKARRTMALKGGIRKHGAKDWRALKAIGEVTDPEQFMPQVKIHVANELSAAVERLTAALAGDPPTLERALEALTGGLRAAETEGDSDAGDDDGREGGAD